MCIHGRISRIMVISWSCTPQTVNRESRHRFQSMCNHICAFQWTSHCVDFLLPFVLRESGLKSFRHTIHTAKYIHVKQRPHCTLTVYFNFVYHQHELKTSCGSKNLQINQIFIQCLLFFQSIKYTAL